MGWDLAIDKLQHYAFRGKQKCAWRGVASVVCGKPSTRRGFLNSYIPAHTDRPSA